MIHKTNPNSRPGCDEQFSTRILFEQLDQIVVFAFGIQIFSIPKSIWYLIFGFFGTPNSIRVFKQLDQIPFQIVLHIIRTKCHVWDKYLYFSFIFPKSCILLGIQYLVFKQLDQILLFIFGIQIFLIPNSIWYSDFLNTKQYSVLGFSQYRIVFDIRYSVISENRIIFGMKHCQVEVQKEYFWTSFSNHREISQHRFQLPYRGC